MGINLLDAKLLLKLVGAQQPQLDRVLTLGRQQLFFDPNQLAQWAENRSDLSDQALNAFMTHAKNEGPADPLFTLLGVKHLDSLDFSNYEGATLCHDLNLPIPESLKAQFDLVFDGGTLEHVFNFPVALKNAMELVRPDGILISVVPANNQVGHGFYQFSPELFYNALSKENGFEVLALIAVEISPFRRCYRVANPAVLRERVTLSNRWPVNLFVFAKKTATQPIFTKPPLQSDYQLKWKDTDRPAIHSSASAPRRFAALIKTLGSGFGNRRHFERIRL